MQSISNGVTLDHVFLSAIHHLQYLSIFISLNLIKSVNMAKVDDSLTLVTHHPPLSRVLNYIFRYVLKLSPHTAIA